MRIAICDDDKIFHSNFEEYLEKYFFSLDIIIDTYGSGEELLKAYNSKKVCYDLIFLDMEMDKINGIDTAKGIRNIDEDVILIFLTSHVEYAPEGYEVNAYRFLTKPINEMKLINALKDVNREFIKNKKLVIKDGHDEVLIKIRDILYIEAKNNNISINIKNHNFLIRKTLNEIEEELSSDMFFRTHRSYLVNLSYVRIYDNKEIQLENGEKIVISRNKAKEFKSSIINYIRNYAK